MKNKGMSAILATILMLMITIAMASMAYLYIPGYFFNLVNNNKAYEDNKVYCKSLMEKLGADSFEAHYTTDCKICWDATKPSNISVGDRNYTESEIPQTCKTYVVK